MYSSLMYERMGKDGNLDISTLNALNKSKSKSENAKGHFFVDWKSSIFDLRSFLIGQLPIHLLKIRYVWKHPMWYWNGDYSELLYAKSVLPITLLQLSGIALEILFGFCWCLSQRFFPAYECLKLFLLILIGGCSYKVTTLKCSKHVTSLP